MIIYIITLVLSFLLDGFVPNYTNILLNNNSLFSTTFSISAIIIIAPYIENNKKYLIISLIIGALFDIAYTNTFLLNMFVFLILSLIIRFLYQVLSNHPILPIILSVLGIVLYNCITYIILIVCNYTTLSINNLITCIEKNLIMTIIYSSIITIILHKLDKNHKLKIIK